MNEVLEKPMRAHVEKLQSEMAKMPQVELPTQHFFADGMYCRYLQIGRAHV